MRWTLIVLAFSLISACGKTEPTEADAAQSLDRAEVVSKASLGPVRARLHMDPAQPRFGDRIRWLLVIEAQPEAKVGELIFGSRCGHFRIRDHQDATPANAPSGERRIQLQVELEHAGTNIGRLPPIPFEVISGEGAGTARRLILPAVEVEAPKLSETEHPELSSLGAALAPVALPRKKLRIAWWWWAGGGLLLLGAAWLILGRRSPGTQGGVALIDPVAEARAALEELEASGLLDRGEYGLFYAKLSFIPRRFIERTTGIHAPEQTTEEFLREMEGREAFGEERRAELRRFLEASDLIKFAGAIPGNEEVSNAIERTRVFCGIVSSSEKGAAS